MATGDGLKRQLTAIAKRGLRRAGFVVKRYTAGNVDELRILRLLQQASVDAVLDVGANTGQYATGLRRAGYRGLIASFEPQREAHRALTATAADDDCWVVASRQALGAEAGVATLHLAGNSVSSSLQPMLDAHVSAAPNSAYVGTEEVPVARLDTALPAALEGCSRLHLKIDTQGFEEQVLAGCSKLWPRVVTAQVELSLTPVYGGALGFREMLDRMDSYGFEPFALLPEFSDPVSGRMLFMDGLFCRKGRSAGASK